MDDQKLATLKSRSFISTVSLLGQSSYSAVLGFAAFFILTLKSGVYLLGIYGAVIASMSAFNYFTNLGLAAAIMQKKEVKEHDLSTAFFIQFALTTIAVVIGFLITPQVVAFYKDLPPGGVYLYWAVLGSFFLLSLKTIPSVLMEREIQIYKVVAVQAVENTLFYLTIIVMVFAGYEIESLVVAVLARSVLGLVLIYIMRPWYPKTGFSYVSAKRLLSYGLPFQGNSFLALIKDDLLIIYLGGAIGLTNLGFVTFAKKWSEFSLRIITDNMNRVAFPLFARFQTNKVLLKKSLKKVFFFSSFFIFPMIVGAIFVFDSVLRVIPGYFDKWGIALFSFYFFSLYALIVSLYTPLINLFNAIGKVKISLYFMIIFTVVQWALVLLSIPIFGFHGISIAFLAMSVLAVFVIRHAKKYLAFSLWEFVKENLYAVVVMVMYLVLVRMAFIIFVDMPRVHVALSMVGGAGIYFVMIYRLKGREFYRELFDMAKVGRKSL